MLFVKINISFLKFFFYFFVNTAEAPIDAGEFLSTLPASLRQSVLADLEESQLTSLPAELAAEAQTLRRELEQRNRAVMHERFFGHSNAAITSILRNTVNRLDKPVEYLNNQHLNKHLNN